MGVVQLRVGARRAWPVAAWGCTLLTLLASSMAQSGVWAEPEAARERSGQCAVVSLSAERRYQSSIYVYIEWNLERVVG